MRNPAQKMTPAFMKTVTMRGNRRLENQIRLMERVRDDTERDNIMTAPQAMEYGLIDEVISSDRSEDK